MKNKKNKSAFSLVESSIVLLLIAFIVVAVLGGAKLVAISRLAAARNLTATSPVMEIPGLVLWLESTLKSSFIESQANSGVIGIWFDQNPGSDTKNNAISAGINRPSFVSNAINGLPALGFDGTNDNIVVAANGSTDLTAWTIFVVLTISVNKNYNLILVKGTDVFENFEIGAYGIGSFVPVFKATDGSRPNLSGVAGTAVNGVPSIYTLRFKNDASVGIQFYENATIVQQDQSASFLKTPLVSTIDNNLYIGSETTTGAANLNGYIGEVIIFNRALSDVERQDVENYLSKKWRIKFY